MLARLVAKPPEWLPLLLILALGLALRLYGLDSRPPPMHVDEAIIGNRAREIGHLDLLSADVGHSTAIAFLFYSPLLQLPWEGVWLLRLTSVVLGMFTIMTTYWLAKEMFDRRVGLMAAFFMGTSHVALAFSRLGMNNIQVPLWEGLTFLFLWRALKRGRVRDWVLLGVSTGTGMYLYFGFRAIPVVLTLFFLGQGLRHLSFFRKHAKGMLLAAAVSVVVTVPLWVRVVQEPRQVIQETTNVTLVSNPEAFRQGYGTHDMKKVLWYQFEKTMGWFTEGGDPSTQYGYQGAAVDALTRILLFSGLVVALLRLGDARYLLLFLSFWVTLVLGGVLTWAPPQAPRLLAVLPAVTIVAAATALEVSRRLMRLLPPLLVGAALVALGGAVAYLNTDAYFYRYSEKDVYWPWVEPKVTLARYINSLESPRVYILSTPDVYADQSILRFLTHGRGAEIVDIGDWGKGQFRFDQQVSARGTVFILLPENKFLLPKLASQYKGNVREFRGYVGVGLVKGELFASYELSP